MNSVPKISIYIIGKNYSGKTSFINRLQKNSFKEKCSIKTVTAIILKYIYINKETLIELNVHDTEGKEHLTSSDITKWPTDCGIVLLFDVSNQYTFTELEKWLIDIGEVKELSNFPIVLVGNKIDSDREVFQYEAEILAEKFKIEYFETSAKSGRGIDEVLNYIGHYTYLKRKPTYIQKKSVVPRKELSTNDLKNMIVEMDKLTNANEKHKKIKEIESFLEEMKTCKCDINYQKYFSLLFMNIYKIPDKEDLKDIYANVYIQLNRIFPDTSKFLHNWLSKNPVIKIIHSLKDKQKRKTYYSQYTNDYDNLQELQCQDLITIFNFVFCEYIQEQKITFSFFDEFRKIIYSLNYQLQNIYQRKIKVGRRHESPYILIIIESFIDFFIFLLVKSLYDNNKDLCVVINLIDNFFTMYLNIKRLVCDKDNTLSYKIIILYCLFYTGYPSYIVTISKQISFFIQNYKDIFFKILFDIILSINIPQNFNSIIFKFSKPICTNYFHLLMKTTPEEYEELLNTSILNEYCIYMNERIISHDSINLFKGCINLLSSLYHNFENFISMYDTEYPPLLILDLLEGLIQKEKYNKEITCFLSIYVKSKSTMFKNEEWSYVIRILKKLAQYFESQKSLRDLKQGYNNYTFVYFNHLYPIFQVISNYQDVLMNHLLIANDICIICISLSHNIHSLNRDFIVLLSKFCINFIEKGFSQLIEPCVPFSFSSIYLENKSNEIPNEEILIDYMDKIVLTGDTRKIDSIRQAIIKNYSEIQYTILMNSLETQYINYKFTKLMVDLILNSNDNCNEILILLFTEYEIKYLESQYTKEDLAIKSIDLNIFLEIYNQLLNKANNSSHQKIMSYLIEMSLSKRLFFETVPNTLVYECKTISLMTMLIQQMKVTKEGKITFSRSTNFEDSICRKKTNVIEDSSKVYIDIDSIVANYIYYIGLWAGYPNTFEYSHKCEDNWNFQLQQNEIASVYTIIEIIFNSLYLLSQENFLHIILIFNFIITNATSHRFIRSVLRCLMMCNYLLNYQSEDFYFNTVEEQKNEILFKIEKDFQIKDTILQNLKELYKENIYNYIETKEHYFIFVAINFYFNATLDKELSLREQKINFELVSTLKHIDDLVTFLFFQIKPSNAFDIKDNLLTLMTFFILKDIIKLAESSKIIKYIYMLLLLSHPNESQLINSHFKKHTNVSKNIKMTNLLKTKETEPFYNHFSDNLLLYYISFLTDNIKKKENNIGTFLCSLPLLFKQIKNKTNRDIIIEKRISMLLSKEKRSNINEKEIIKHIDEYKFLLGDNNTIFFCKNNDVIVLNSISNIQYKLSFTPCTKHERKISQSDTKLVGLTSLFSKDDQIDSADLIDNDKNLNEKYLNFPLEDMFYNVQFKKVTKNAIKDALLILLKTPIIVTYHVNLFFFSNQYDSLSLNNLLNAIDTEEINPMFYEFLTKLGDIYINDDGEKILSYKDNIYEIVFELVDLKQSKEEKIELIKENRVNIIWIDDSYLDITHIDSMFNSHLNKKEATIISISPKTESHLLVTTKRLSQKENSDKKINIHDFFADHFYMNLTAGSSIRYLLSLIVASCDWHYFIQKNTAAMNEKEILPNVNINNCFVERLNLIQNLYENF